MASVRGDVARTEALRTARCCLRPTSPQVVGHTNGRPSWALEGPYCPFLLPSHFRSAACESASQDLRRPAGAARSRRMLATARTAPPCVPAWVGCVGCAALGAARQRGCVGRSRDGLARVTIRVTRALRLVHAMALRDIGVVVRGCEPQATNTAVIYAPCARWAASYQVKNRAAKSQEPRPHPP